MNASRRAKREGSLRVPARARPEGSERPPRSDKPLLRLALSKGHLAIELETSFELGPFVVEELSVLLPDVRFPVDLSGGVAKFRHRRGRLARMVLRADASALARALAPLFPGLAGQRRALPEVVVAPTAWGAIVGVASAGAAVAFDVLAAPMGGDLRLLVDAARGVGLGAPAYLVAARALASALGAHAELHGTAIILRDVARPIARHLLPAAGARAPSIDEVELEVEAPLGSRALRLTIEAGAAPPPIHERTLAALEIAELVEAPDAWAMAGAFDDARRGYLAALERAPRDRTIALRLAALDAAHGARGEAALGTIAEAMPAVDAGPLGAELLAEVGDADGAFAALQRAATLEPFGPLAALEWLRAAEIAERAELGEEAIDQALARAPTSTAARWKRFELRVSRGDVRGALGDAEHLEADAETSEDRAAACMRAAAVLAEAGFLKEARTRYERALRARPASPEAVIGLARALRDLGQTQRAIDLFARASALSTDEPLVAASADLELARSLAMAGNAPAAIARAAKVPPEGELGLEARALEVKLRAELGDATGASRVSARLRALAEIHRPTEGEGHRIARTLVATAKIEEELLGDRAAAFQCLSIAIRLSPADRTASSEYRRVARAMRERAPLPESGVEAQPFAPAPREPVPEPRPTPRTSPGDLPPRAAAPAAAPEPPLDEAAAEARIEELTARLRGDPKNAAVASELASLLEAVGRDLELLSLLSARVDEASEDERPALAKERVRVTARLAEKARVEGRISEAELYESMLAIDT